jgi:hypothetical protein
MTVVMGIDLEPEVLEEDPVPLSVPVSESLDVAAAVGEVRRVGRRVPAVVVTKMLAGSPATYPFPAQYRE